MSQKPPAGGVAVEVGAAAEGTDLAVAEGAGDGQIGHHAAGDRDIPVGAAKEPAAAAQAGEK